MEPGRGRCRFRATRLRARVEMLPSADSPGLPIRSRSVQILGKLAGAVRQIHPGP